MIDPDFFQPEAPPSPGLFSHSPLSSLFGAEREDEDSRPAAVGQSEAGRKHLAFL